MRTAMLLAALSGLVMLTSYDASAQSRHRNNQQIPRDARAHVGSQTAPQTPGWCLGGSPTNGSCIYYSLEQCLQDRIGQGGNCSVNPRSPRIEP